MEPNVLTSTIGSSMSGNFEKRASSKEGVSGESTKTTPLGFGVGRNGTQRRKEEPLMNANFFLSAFILVSFV